MPSKYDLIQMINRNNHDVEDTIQDVNDLIEDIDKDPKKFTYELSTELEEFAEKLNRCPLCGSELTKLKSDYESSEYLGQPVQEEILRYGCESSTCTYTKQ
jgi:uncharacterized protein with PIN domain